MAKRESKTFGQFITNPPLEIQGWSATEMVEANVTFSYIYSTMVGRHLGEQELKRLDTQNFRLESEVMPDWSHLFAPVGVYREACWRLLFGEKYTRGMESVQSEEFRRRKTFCDEAIKRVAYVWGYENTYRGEIWSLEFIVLRPKLHPTAKDMVSRVIACFPSIANIKNAIKIIQKNNLIVEANAKCIRSKTNIRLIQSAEYTTQAWRQAAVVEADRMPKGKRLQEAFNN